MRAHLSKIVILLRRLLIVCCTDMMRFFSFCEDVKEPLLDANDNQNLHQTMYSNTHDGTPYGDYTDQAKSHYANKLDMHEWNNPPLTS